jgi:hypothetical protein
MLWRANAVVRFALGTAAPTMSNVAASESGSQFVISRAASTTATGD